MDYSSLLFRAEVDWIEIEIHTKTPTNFWTVQKVLRQYQHLPKDVNPYVNVQDERPGGAATVFRIRIQDPKSLHALSELCSGFAQEIPIQGAPQVTAIEVALDAYQSNPEQAARFYKFVSFVADASNQRLFRKKSDPPQSTPTRFDSLVCHLADGWQVGIGDKFADCYQHIYWKTTDNGQTLPDEKHRARIEITLRGEVLPFHSLDDSEGFNFTKLTQYFRFRQLKDDLSPLIRLCVNAATSQIGERRTHKLKSGAIRWHNSATRADTELNDRARGAFKELNRRWTAEPKRGRKTTADRMAVGSPE